jgi:hypothetical protein
MRIVVDRSCFLETSTPSGDKTKNVVLLSTRVVERVKTLGEIFYNSQRPLFSQNLQFLFSSC